MWHHWNQNGTQEQGCTHSLSEARHGGRGFQARKGVICSVRVWSSQGNCRSGGGALQVGSCLSGGWRCLIHWGAAAEVWETTVSWGVKYRVVYWTQWASTMLTVGKVRKVQRHGTQNELHICGELLVLVQIHVLHYVKLNKEFDMDVNVCLS